MKFGKVIPIDCIQTSDQSSLRYSLFAFQFLIFNSWSASPTFCWGSVLLQHYAMGDFSGGIVYYDPKNPFW